MNDINLEIENKETRIDEIKSELETLCREIYSTGYSRGVKEGILD